MTTYAHIRLTQIIIIRPPLSSNEKNLKICFPAAFNLFLYFYLGMRSESSVGGSPQKLCRMTGTAFNFIIEFPEVGNPPAKNGGQNMQNLA